ncbi:MAG TPA: hypothetical protein VNB22_12450 [Pyrinomonadaceae bacterium]|jgi:hypothetical protein|nr:hypothetical protein [Pyrinomonadaceae bacterium]
MKKFLASGIIVFISVIFLGMNVLGQGRVDFRINPNANQMDNNLGNDRDTNPNNPKGFAPSTGGTGTLSPLSDHGGPVINTPTIYLIWYGNWNQTNGTDTPAGKQIVRDWANSIGGTPHFALNSSYSTTKPISGNVLYGGETTDAGTKTRLTDSNIKAIVDSAITSGRLPYNASGVYFVITSSNVTASSGFCTQYCGWHTRGTTSGYGNVRYSFVGNAARCINSCAAQTVSPNGNAGIDGAISVLTHELEEATTDPDLNAWYDSSGAENADKCAWTFGHNLLTLPGGAYYNMTFGGRNWLIQRNLWKSGSSWLCMVNSSQN